MNMSRLNKKLQDIEDKEIQVRLAFLNYHKNQLSVSLGHMSPAHTQNHKRKYLKTLIC